uniref:Uncharacterized protein n=1 Tax=Sphenodon punctatus TaxID=8508 RepID=A0A8D0GFE0_SPHPU
MPQASRLLFRGGSVGGGAQRGGVSGGGAEDIGAVTSRWERVKMTGSMRKTRLDSLLMEAAMTCEFTTSEGLRDPASLPSLTVAFSVERKKPRLLYRINTTFTTPGERGEDQRMGEGEGKGPSLQGFPVRLLNTSPLS